MHLPPLPDTANIALFLDFDGTLVEIADHPELVKLGNSTRDALKVISDHLGGALAIITGREIDDIDRFTAPLRLPVAGIHGTVLRTARGDVLAGADVSGIVSNIEARLAPLVDRQKGLVLERKRSAIALHYRARPDLESECLAAFEKALASSPEMELKRGKMVLEAKPNGKNKGTAVLDFLTDPPFYGRLPWFAGDDITDEDAFAAVNRLGGVSIKIGEGETAAPYRADSTRAFLSWLESEASKFSAEVKR
jgi:trehalose 6-phosphate phosphatase